MDNTDPVEANTVQGQATERVTRLAAMDRETYRAAERIAADVIEWTKANPQSEVAYSRDKVRVIIARSSLYRSALVYNAYRAQGSAEPLCKTSRDFPEDYEHENGNYHNACHICGHVFRGHKRRVTCKLCEQGSEDCASIAPTLSSQPLGKSSPISTPTTDVEERQEKGR